MQSHVDEHSPSVLAGTAEPAGDGGTYYQQVWFHTFLLASPARRRVSSSARSTPSAATGARSSGLRQHPDLTLSEMTVEKLLP